MQMKNEQTLNSYNEANGVEQAPLTYSRKALCRFILPSLLGVLLFMTPMVLNGKLTIVIAYLIDTINALIAPYMVVGSVVLTIVPSIITVIVSSIPALRKSDSPALKLFNPGLAWTITRVLGSITVLMIFYKVGPEWIWNRNTGGVQLYDVAPVILVMCFVSSILMPLLSDYGLMDFIGTLFSRIFSFLFNLPGRAAVDSLASCLSSSTVGIILTMRQYKDGYYTRREAATICTNFSFVSIAFSYVLLKFVHLEAIFIPWYMSVLVSAAVCAMILPKLPPLRNVSNQYAQDKNTTATEACPREGESLFNRAVRLGVQKAEKSDDIVTQMKKGVHLTCDILFTIYPAMMILGVIGLSIIEYTSVIQTLAMPLAYLLELLQLPDATLAATAMLAGFIDMLMPVIIGSGIESELTRFVIAGVAINGIIFLTEVAVIMLRFDIGLNLLNLFFVWVLRLLISLPVFTLMGNLIL